MNIAVTITTMAYQTNIFKNVKKCIILKLNIQPKVTVMYKHKIRNLYCSIHVSKMSFQHKKQTFTDIQVKELR